MLVKDYYKILNINPNVSEKELHKMLEKRIDYIKKEINEEKSTSKTASKLVIVICENFLKTLEHYGSKENYDRALQLKYNKKVNVNKRFKFNKKMAIKTGIFVLAGTAIILSASYLDTVEVPIYTGQTLGDICAEYNVSELEIIGDGLKSKEYKFVDNDSFTVLSTSKKVDDIKDKIEQKQNDDEKDEVQTYPFYYIVKFGDTASELKEKLKLNHMPNINIVAGEKIRLRTTDYNIAEEMKKQYEIDTTLPEPTEYEYYEVEPGDNLNMIAKKFGVTPQILVEFNNISDPQMINVGQKLIIVYEYVTGAEALEMRNSNQSEMKF